MDEGREIGLGFRVRNVCCGFSERAIGLVEVNPSPVTPVGSDAPLAVSRASAKDGRGVGRTAAGAPGVGKATGSRISIGADGISVGLMREGDIPPSSGTEPDMDGGSPAGDTEGGCDGKIGFGSVLGVPCPAANIGLKPRVSTKETDDVDSEVLDSVTAPGPERQRMPDMDEAIVP